MAGKLPNVTIVIVTLNNERSLDTCLKAIASQDYPKDSIEYLNIDGGSTDKTKQIFQKYGYKTVESPIKRDAEAQRGVGLKLARHNLVVSLDADNYLPNAQWLRRMVQPFIDDSAIVHAGTLHYHYDKSDTPFNRYNALFGSIDPIVYYVGRPDRIPQYERKWKKGHIVKETKEYTIVEFTQENLPTVGCNGVIYRKDVLIKHAQSDPKNFLHIDVFADLIAGGYNRFAIVNVDIIHDTAINLSFLMKKRIAFLSSYYLKSNLKRRYLIFDPSKGSHRIRLVLYIAFTVTLLKPIIDSMRGFFVYPDLAWFLHPVVCWIYLYAYGVASIKRVISRR